MAVLLTSPVDHDDVIKWKHFPRYWPFVWGIHRSPVNSPHKGQWRGALMFSLFCVWTNGWVNNREAGDLRRYRVHYDVIVMFLFNWYRAWTGVHGLPASHQFTAVSPDLGRPFLSDDAFNGYRYCGELIKSTVEFFILDLNNNNSGIHVGF